MSTDVALVIEVDTDGPDDYGPKFLQAGRALPPKPSPGVWKAEETTTGYRFRFIPRQEN